MVRDGLIGRFNPKREAHPLQTTEQSTEVE